MFSYCQLQQNSGTLNAYYIFNQKKDTLFFPNIERERFATIKYALTDSIQIDQKGNKEIIISIYLDSGTSEHGGTFDKTKKLQYSKYEIWNLATKEKLFEVFTSYLNQYSIFDARINPETKKGFQFSTCEFIYNDKQLEISNFKYATSSEIQNKTIEAHGEEKQGMYQFIGNKYV